MGFKSRDPDLHTESFKLWKLNKKESLELSNDSLEFKYRGIKFDLHGFEIIRSKNNEIMFVFKVKPLENAIIYYIPDGAESKYADEIDGLFEGLKSDPIFTLFNLRDTLENAYQQKETIGKL